MERQDTGRDAMIDSNYDKDLGEIVVLESLRKLQSRCGLVER
jgi:hypothetical protein